MFNWLKKFWDDAGKEIFLRKYILPAGTFFFSWGFLGHIYSSNLEIADLEQNIGTVERIDILAEHSRSGTHQPLVITLSDNPRSFRIPDQFKYRFTEFKNKILIGDSITIYSRNWPQTLIGMGRKNDVYQIDNGLQPIFQLKWMTGYVKNQADIFGFLAIICLVIYGLLWYERWSEKKAAYNKGS